jgi:hypothetical protein
MTKSIYSVMRIALKRIAEHDPESPIVIAADALMHVDRMEGSNFEDDFEDEELGTRADDVCSLDGECESCQ